MEDFKKRERLSEKQLFERFKMMFPNYADHVVRYRKSGSNMLSITFDDSKSRVFLYNNENNWTFATKLYRVVPETYQKHLEQLRKESEKNP